MAMSSFSTKVESRYNNIFYIILSIKFKSTMHWCIHTHSFTYRQTSEIRRDHNLFTVIYLSYVTIPIRKRDYRGMIDNNMFHNIQ